MGSSHNAQVLRGLKPEKVFFYFGEIASIPHGSKNEKQLSDYIFRLGKEKGWTVFEDGYNNVVIKKRATPGYESAPTLALQAHLDMVCEKDPGVAHDFLKDPIKLRIEGPYLYATGTTLGADNGIGVALLLALLDTEELRHPALEVLLTADEEADMTGIKNFDGSLITARDLLNMDSKMDYLTVACAGGRRFAFRIPFAVEKSAKKVTCKISVGGLKGGHSGAEIDKERGNAIKLLGRILSDLCGGGAELVRIDAEGKANVIPRNASALVNVDDPEALAEKLAAWQAALGAELAQTDAGVQATMQEAAFCGTAMRRADAEKLIRCILLIPSGTIVRDLAKNEALYSNNLGAVMLEQGAATLLCLSRSSLESLLDSDYLPRMHAIADALGVEGVEGAGFPCWEYAEDSMVRDVCAKTYFELNGSCPEIISRHAGSECGFILKKCPSLRSAVATGSRMFAMHTTDEHLDIAAVETAFCYLSKVLENYR